MKSELERLALGVYFSYTTREDGNGNPIVVFTKEQLEALAADILRLAGRL